MADSARPTLESLLRRAREQGRPVILDAATGTELEGHGVDTGSPVWSGRAPLEHADLLRLIHRGHVAAGADVVTACTFRTTRRAFQAAGDYGDSWRRAATAAVRIAREAAGSRALVAGSIAPLEDCWHPERAPTGAACRTEHGLLAAELVSAGVDVLWLETFGAVGEIEAASDAALEAGTLLGVPFAVSMTTAADGSLLSGEPLEDGVAAARDRGAAAVLINCVPAWFVDRALPRLLACAGDTPAGVYASLARAELAQCWEGSAFLEPADYAELAAGWVDRGARLIGACCGSTAEHVTALRGLLE